MPERAPAATGIGSSQIAALAGLHAYRDAFDVFNEVALGLKSKRADHLDWGRNVEPAILAHRQRQLDAVVWEPRKYAEQYGARYIGGGTSTTVRAEVSVIALASCDAVFSLDQGMEVQVEEAKSVGYHESWDWGDDDEDCPVGYRLQNLWQQGVLGIHQGEIVASVAGAPPAAWPVPFDARTYENLVIIAERFWFDHVLTKRPPHPVDGSDAATDYLRARYPVEELPMAVQCPPDLAELAIEWEQVDEWAGAIEAKAKDLKNRICDSIAERAGYVLPDNRWLTWRSQRNSHGGTSRILRIQKANRRRP